jgi:integrase
MSKTFAGSLAQHKNRRPYRLVDQPALTLATIRDRAIVGILRYADASIDAVIALRVEDYYSIDSRRWLRIVQDGIERHQLVDAQLEDLIDKYLLESGIEKEPRSSLFRSTLSGNGKISSRSVHRYHVAKLARQVSNLRSVQLTPDSAGFILNNIRPTTRENVRDRAIIGLILYAVASPREIAAIRKSNYLDNGNWCCIKLARSRIIEVPKALCELLREYVRAEDPPEDGLLFRVDRTRGMTASGIEKMIRRRLNEAPRPLRVG